VKFGIIFRLNRLFIAQVSKRSKFENWRLQTIAAASSPDVTQVVLGFGYEAYNALAYKINNTAKRISIC